jgi:hypothetical protein
MPYERDLKKSVSPTVIERALKLTDDLCCDGCEERCLMSIQLEINNKKYNKIEKNQIIYAEPVMFVGNKKLPDVEYLSANTQRVGDGVRMELFFADVAYRYALALCRKTCKNSRVK